MCFNITVTHPEPFIATEDIKVYKQFSHRGHLRSEYMYFIYKRGELYHTSFGIEMHNRHWQSIQYNIGVINEGFHSTIKKRRYENNRLVNVLCIIPKGATYYLNLTAGERVSNQLIIPLRWQGKLQEWYKKTIHKIFKY